MSNPAAQASLEPVDWHTRPIAELTRHLVETHHAYLREALPRLSEWIALIEKVHGPSHEELHAVAGVYQQLQSALLSHIDKEEARFFPYCVDVEAGHQEASQSWLAQRLAVHQGEHGDVKSLLRQLRKLTHDYAVPEDACGSYQMTLEGLAELEEDTAQHIHKENEILFMRVAALASAG